MVPIFPLAMAVTNFGESTVLLTTAICVSGWFWLSRQRRLAILWLLAVGGCAASMVVLKITFLTCGQFLFGDAVHTPSGHSSMAALFYGAAALTLGRVSPPAARHRTLMLAAAFLFALIIGLSRIIIHAHTPQEVAVGLSVGFAWLGCFALLLRHVQPSVEMPPVYVLVALGAIYGGLLTLTMVGEHMTVEGLLHHVAQLLHIRWDVCAG